MQAVSARSYSRNSGNTCDDSVTGKSGYSRSTITPTCSSCAGEMYELMNAIVSDSTPDSTRSRMTCSAWASSTGVTASPRASIRSVISRVSAREAGGSGLIMMIQPANGPGVCDRARCRIWAKPLVVKSPTRAPFDSSTAFVATVVPWRMLRISPISVPASPAIRLTPVRTPSDGSAGVDGVFTRWSEPVSSWTSRRSVKVPPTSTPSL